MGSSAIVAKDILPFLLLKPEGGTYGEELSNYELYPKVNSEFRKAQEELHFERIEGQEASGE